MGKVEVMYDLIQKWPFDVMINHNRFTLLNRQADKLFDLAKKRGIKILMLHLLWRNFSKGYKKQIDWFIKKYRKKT